MKDWLIWQLADSAFPSGGFAHSGGMEAAWQHGVIQDADSLRSFIETGLKQLKSGVLQFVNLAWQEPENLSAIDEAAELFLNNHVSRRASRAQGRAFLAAATVFGNEAIAQWTRRVRSQEVQGHLAPVFGLVCRETGVECAMSSRLFGFIFLRSQISVAVRLGIIGPLEGQELQARFSREFQDDWANPTTDGPIQNSPVMDLLQGTQDRLYSRLFQS